MVSVTLKELLEAGVHFGHQTRRWNSKMKPYIFGARNGIYIIDLQKTLKKFREALGFVDRLANDGGSILFVGTKRQAQESVAEEAQRCEMSFVNQRWLGGLLTNFTTIQSSLGRLRELEAMSTDGRYEALSKKEIARIEKEKRKLQKNLQSTEVLMNPNIRNMGEHFGGTAYQDVTNIHPLSIAAIRILGIVMLWIPRRWSVLPILGITCFIPLTQRVTVFSMDFNILRIMILIGILRYDHTQRLY